LADPTNHPRQINGFLPLLLHFFQKITANHENKIRINPPGLHELKKWFCRPNLYTWKFQPGCHQGIQTVRWGFSKIKPTGFYVDLQGMIPSISTMGFLRGCTENSGF